LSFCCMNCASPVTFYNYRLFSIRHDFIEALIFSS
jgi:hypothetical protein